VDEELERVVELELELLRPDVRSDRTRLEELLHPEFIEFGASGRRWQRADIIGSLTAETSSKITATDVDARRLAEDVVLVTYQSHTEQRNAWRSSIWCLNDRRWQVLFHQGTVI
jgi:hypothetical protein